MKNIETLEWSEIKQSLNSKGYAQISSLLAGSECDALKDLYSQPNLYRSIISMERYRFGKGEYKYFNYPLPEMIMRLRTEFYPHLSMLANEWNHNLKIEITYPSQHHQFIQMCEKHHQVRPTPLILKYSEGGYNTLHQDLYGDVYFPFQIVIVLTEPNLDHQGGELVFVEQLPRAQSRAEVVSPQKGDAIIFTTNFRPVQGTKGFYRAKMKHGVSPLKKGERFALGIIFHDAV